MQKLLIFFSKSISIYAIFNDQSFNDTLTIYIMTSLVLNNWAQMLWSMASDMGPHCSGLCLLVCAEVLRPSQPNGVMLSMVSLPNHMFTGQI